MNLQELNLVGASRSFLTVVGLIRKVAMTDASVLALGETGTGKEVAARAIHYLGARQERPFIPVNCGGLPEQLIENELFGHERGAFTDAREARTGVLAQAQGGTLFLDEVDSLSLKGQVSLLRFFQDQRYRPVGSSRERHADVRVIAAGSQDLSRRVETGAFRRDLFYRLHVLTVDLPPLRERTGDAVLLAQHFLRLHSLPYGKSAKRLDTTSIGWIDAYAWPGNVRELENLVLREFFWPRASGFRYGVPCRKASAAPGGTGATPTPWGWTSTRQEPSHRGLRAGLPPPPPGRHQRQHHARRGALRQGTPGPRQAHQETRTLTRFLGTTRRPRGAVWRGKGYTRFKAVAWARA